MPRGPKGERLPAVARPLKNMILAEAGRGNY